MKITLGGLGGTGTSTVGRLLAERLGYQFMSGGDMFRLVAEEAGMTMEEHDEFKKKSKSKEFDLLIDGKQKEFGEQNDDFVIESRLGWYLVPDAFKVLLTCDLDVRMKRIFDNTSKNRIAYVPESLEETKRKGLEREENHRQHIEDIYGIENLADPKHYDCVVDTTDIVQEAVVDKIIAAATTWSGEKSL